MKPTRLWFVLLGLPAFALQAAEVGNISPSEQTAVVQRVITLNLEEVGFGPSLLQDMGHDGLAYHLVAGVQREATPDAAIRAQANTDFSPGHAWEGDATLGMAYFFSRNDFSPLVSAGFGWGFADGKGWNNGFSLSATGGMQMFRTATTQLSLEAGPRIVLSSGKDGMPVVWSLGLNLFW
ncbi:MAG TPA: hypothetical protein VN931_03740 [Fibrobacteria bacterium]|nr:hypothetical protein [Fibrobacteria bacterium]